MLYVVHILFQTNYLTKRGANVQLNSSFVILIKYIETQNMSFFVFLIETLNTFKTFSILLSVNKPSTTIEKLCYTCYLFYAKSGIIWKLKS